MVRKTPARRPGLWPFHWLLLATAVALGGPAAPAAAQTSAEDEIIRLQAEKAKDLKPPTKSRAEQIIERIERGLTEMPSGVYPATGSVYSGGGFTVGAGYRRMFGDAVAWNTLGLYSIKNYKLVETAITSPGHARGRLTFDLRGGWRDATQVGYYGLGIDTALEDRANFRFKQLFGGGSALWQPKKWSVLQGSLFVDDYSLESGKGSEPSIEEVHTPDTAPGLGASPTYVHTSGTAAIDTRSSPGYSRVGGYYGVTLHNYTDTGDEFSFDRADVELIHHVPVLRETWVISLRGRMQTTLGDEDVVPYFLMPGVGSGSTLRGYKTLRFRDRHSLLTTVEWRWIPNRLGLDMAIFYDAGKVAAERRHLDFHDMRSNWGIGARFHGPSFTPLRIEVAHGSDGWKLILAGRSAF
jgi:hypothetical protein